MVNLRDRANRSTASTPTTTLQSTTERTGNAASIYASRSPGNQPIALRSRGTVVTRLNGSTTNRPITETLGQTLGNLGEEIMKWTQGTAQPQLDFQAALQEIPEKITDGVAYVGKVLTGQTDEAKRQREETLEKIGSSGVAPKPVISEGFTAAQAVGAILPAGKLATIGESAAKNILLDLPDVPKKITLGGAGSKVKSGADLITLPSDSGLKLAAAGGVGAAALGLSEVPNKIGNEYQDVYNYWKNKNKRNTGGGNGYKSGDGDYVPAQKADTTNPTKPNVVLPDLPAKITVSQVLRDTGKENDARRATTNAEVTRTENSNPTRNRNVNSEPLRNVPAQLSVFDYMSELPAKYERDVEFTRPRETNTKNRNRTVVENENVYGRPNRNEYRYPTPTRPGMPNRRPKRKPPKIPDFDWEEEKKKKAKAGRRVRKSSVVGIVNPLPWLSPVTGKIVKSKPRATKSRRMK